MIIYFIPAMYFWIFQIVEHYSRTQERIYDLARGYRQWSKGNTTLYY